MSRLPQKLDLSPFLRLAHLWFVTIHPFDDGNGRIARAIADMALARSERSAQRFYSMSAQIRTGTKNLLRNAQEDAERRPRYYTLLEWFLSCLDHAFDGTEETLGSVLQKARFWEVHAATQVNERQRLMLNKLLDGLEGKLTSSKWAKLVKCSQDTALRDIFDLVNCGILVKDAGAAEAPAIPWRTRANLEPPAGHH
jgi:Fic family protein